MQTALEKIASFAVHTDYEKIPDDVLDDFSQVCERSSQWCELRYSQVQTAH